MNTLVLDPTKIPNTSVFKINGPVRYTGFKDKSPKGKGNPEIYGVLLQPGPNHNVDVTDVEFVLATDAGKEHEKLGAIRVIKPESETPRGNSTDYNEPTAISIIRDSEDEEWLESSFAQETRPAVRDLIKKQQELIQNRMQSRARAAQSDAN